MSCDAHIEKYIQTLKYFKLFDKHSIDSSEEYLISKENRQEVVQDSYFGMS